MFDFFKKKPAPIDNSRNAYTEATSAEVVGSETEVTVAVEPTKSWSERLKQSLSKTRKQLGNQLASLFGGGKIDAEVYEELETILITSDVGVNATKNLLADIKNRVKVQSLDDTVQLKAALKEAMSDLLTPLQKPLNTTGHKPFVIMLAGVNGAGKTTSIGKLAHAFQAEGKSVLIAAGDTFRAAAREQLQIWGERNNVHVVSQTSGDAAAVMFDAINSAKAKNIDIVLADTAGRLPTQMHLMEEMLK